MDLGGKTVLPGLIDVLAGGGTNARKRAAVQLAINNVAKERKVLFNSISQSDAINEAREKHVREALDARVQVAHRRVVIAAGALQITLQLA